MAQRFVRLLFDFTCKFVFMVSVYSDENSFKFFMYVSANFGLPMGGRTQSYQDVGGAPIPVGHWEGMGGFKKPRTP